MTKKKLSSKPIFGGTIRTSRNIPVKKVFYWFESNEEIKGLDETSFKILDAVVHFSIE